MFYAECGHDHLSGYIRGFHGQSVLRDKLLQTGLAATKAVASWKKDVGSSDPKDLLKV